MRPLSNQQYRRAFEIWLRSFPGRQADLDVIPFLNSDIKAYRPGGWLRKARQARLMSSEQVAQRLEMSRAAYCKFEKLEAEGRITLETLSKLAKGLDCELVYALRPRCRTRFSFRIWQKLLPDCLAHPWVLTRPESKKAVALGAIAKSMMDRPDLRQKHAWTQRKTSQLLLKQ